MSKYIYFSFLIIALVFSRCTPSKKKLKNGKYRTVITLVKLDTFPLAIHSVEHLNKDGKIDNRIRFYEREIIKWRFEKYTYNALNQLVKLEWKFPPLYDFEYKSTNLYNNKGRLKKRNVIDVYSKYNLEYYYDKSNKLLKIVSFDKNENASDWKQNLMYNSLDSLTRVETVYWNDKNRNSRDSIVYGKNRKTTYSIDAENVRTDKNVVIYRKGKIVHEYSYSNNYLSDKDEFYLDEVKTYFYKDDLLIKMIVKHSPINAWCGTGNYGYTEIFTYFYE